MVKAKVCGLTNRADLGLAIELGADFAGFVFYGRSPRAVAPAKARRLVRDARREYPGKAVYVGVFVNEEPDVVRRTCDECGLDLAQLHGDETPEYCRSLARPFWKAVRVRDKSALGALDAYGGEAILVDSFAANAYGGTGQPLSLPIARMAVALGRRVVLAGGISVRTLPEVLALRPWAIDVSSSLEDRPGTKSEVKMREFFRMLNRAGGRS